jgi:ABC-type sugar transport system substrate-binding protein
MKAVRLWALTLLLAVFGAAQAQEITIAMIPKLVGIDYFNATQRGAEEAAAELGNIRLIYRGPTVDRVDLQIELIENFITAGVDVIAVASNDPVAIAPALQRAMDQGIRVLTWDADANARDAFINQASFEGIGRALVEDMVAQVGEEADVAIVTSSLTAPNQNTWIAEMRQVIEAEYPGLNIVDVRPSEEDQQLAFRVTQDLIRAYPNLRGVWALSSVAFPGAAEGVQQAGRAGEVAVVGLSTPSQMRPFMEAGVIQSVVLWNPIDLGYLTVYAARELVENGLEAGRSFNAGRLGEYTPFEDEISLQVLLGPPFIFTPENIGDFNF